MGYSRGGANRFVSSILCDIPGIVFNRRFLHFASTPASKLAGDPRLHAPVEMTKRWWVKRNSRPPHWTPRHRSPCMTCLWGLLLCRAECEFDESFLFELVCFG